MPDYPTWMQKICMVFIRTCTHASYYSKLTWYNMQCRYLCEKHSSTKVENGDITKWMEWEASSLKVSLDCNDCSMQFTFYQISVDCGWCGMVSYCIIHSIAYRIAGKFRGRNFSRLTSLKTFCELNFEDRLDYHCICIL